MLVDQHVAHERVLYEQVVASMTDTGQPGQQLLFPETFRLDPANGSVLMEILEDMGHIGFTVRPFGGDTFIVESAPTGIKPGSATDVIREMVAQRRTAQALPLSESRDALAKSFSCRAAVKAGDTLSEAEMRSRLTGLFSTRLPFVCPHGRPTVMRLSLEELDRRFGRI